MGRAYPKELALLANTYEWAASVAIEPLEAFVAAARGRPLVAVGSGGSATAAHLAALLHRFGAHASARHATPLDLLLNEPNLQDAAVLFLSASGRNPDVLAAAKHCVQRDSRAVAALCTRRGSPLAEATRGFERGYVFEADCPAGKDGFLATNSLVATCVLIARAYGTKLPPAISKLDRQLPPDFGGRSTIVVLYGGWGGPAATDLESKLNESAIASAQVSDYRNFGHGRHLWLARRGPDTTVIMLVTPEVAEIARRTRELIPSDVPVLEARTDFNGAIGTIDLLLQGLELVGRLGELQGFDPGRPSVPEFGRKLFHLAATVTDDSEAPVTRKLLRVQQVGHEQHDAVRSALQRFVDRLRTTNLGGVVLDYDGTLCTRSERFAVLRPELAAECRRLIESGITLGIATGRGRSVRESLQKTLPEELWPQVIVGYYNGGEVAPLDRGNAPVRDASPEPPLDGARYLLERDSLLGSLATCTVRRRQITIEPTRSVSVDALLSYVMTLLAPFQDRGVHALASSHSVDVIPPGVGKLAVVNEVKRRIRPGCEVLCIGDRGQWPGNDCTLLSHEPSLSVDEVSASLATCWNIAPPGVTGVNATLRYLGLVRIADGHATIDGRDLWRSR